MSLPISPALKPLHRLDKPSADFSSQLYDITSGQEYVKCQDLEHDDFVWLIDYLDPSSSASRKCLRELRVMCCTGAILPTSYTLSPQLLEINSIPFTCGASCDVYNGIFDSLEVCIKRVRVYSRDVLQTAANLKVYFGAFHFSSPRNHQPDSQTSHKEVVKWKPLAHQNILSLRGITNSFLIGSLEEVRQNAFENTPMQIDLECSFCCNHSVHCLSSVVRRFT